VNTERICGTAVLSTLVSRTNDGKRIVHVSKILLMQYTYTHFDTDSLNS